MTGIDLKQKQQDLEFRGSTILASVMTAWTVNAQFLQNVISNYIINDFCNYKFRIP